ncbi:MAG: hypothetical protein CVU64_12990 [Deltaproteobacteria bacterium HGW-Deltaproteobacteria-21]|jgi:cob(I)alamin adenosyltransferase|nr:MAG: hypothetical protein CVU64_12990 [Deltaproteobacteria bacterium HGW-Deltaproteobacteria-21]
MLSAQVQSSHHPVHDYRNKGGFSMEITKLVPKEKKGLVVVVTGHGKGKTTTAFGIAVRACGHDLKVCILQFMKGDLYSGEWDE